MKKYLIFFIAVLLLSLPMYGHSQSAPTRDASGVVVGYPTTRLTNVGSMGLNVAGNPGYIMLTGVTVSEQSYVPQYYLWVNATGKLCIASGPKLTNYSQFPEGDWNAQNISNQCTVVGGQS